MRHPADDGYDDMADFQHSAAVPRSASVMSTVRREFKEAKRSEIRQKRLAATPQPGKERRGAPINSDNAQGNRSKPGTSTVPPFIQLARKELHTEYFLSMSSRGWKPEGQTLFMRGAVVSVPNPQTTRMPYLSRPFKVHIRDTGETIWCRTPKEARDTVEHRYVGLDNAHAKADEQLHPLRSPLTRDALVRVFHDYKKGFTHD